MTFGIWSVPLPMSTTEQLCLGPQAPRSETWTKGGIQKTQIMALQVDLLDEMMERDHN